MKKNLDPRSLQALLRQGDPAETLSQERAARVRERIAAAVARQGREAASEARPRALRWGWITAAGLGALALAAGLWRSVPNPDAATGPEEIPGYAQPAAPRTHFDFATPGGTRIIWTLIPERTTERRNG